MDFSFAGKPRYAAASGVPVGGLSATAVVSGPMHCKLMVDPQVAFVLPLSGTGRIIHRGAALDWAAGKTIISNSYSEPLELTSSTTGSLISLRPSTDRLLAALRSIIRDRSGTDGAEADAIMARRLVRGPCIDPGRSWSVDYFSAIMKLVAMFDDCHGNGALLERIGIEDVISRLLARLVLDQEKSSDEPARSPVLTRSTRAVDLICERIRSNIGSPMSISDMEELTGLTGRALNYAFHDRFDCSPQEWQRNFLLDHARRILRDAGSVSSVKALAYELGFASPSSFSASYRQRFGELPSKALSRRFRRPAGSNSRDAPPAEE